MEGQQAGSIPLAARSSNIRISGRSRCLLTPHRNSMAARQTALLGRRLVSAAPHEQLICAARAQHTGRSAVRNSDYATRGPEGQSSLTAAPRTISRDPSLENLEKAINFEAAHGYSDVQVPPPPPFPVSLPNSLGSSLISCLRGQGVPTHLEKSSPHLTSAQQSTAQHSTRAGLLTLPSAPASAADFCCFCSCIGGGGANRGRA